MVVPCILILSSLFSYPTDAQLDCSKGMSEFTLKFISPQIVQEIQREEWWNVIRVPK